MLASISADFLSETLQTPNALPKCRDAGFDCSDLYFPFYEWTTSLPTTCAIKNYYKRWNV